MIHFHKLQKKPMHGKTKQMGATYGAAMSIQTVLLLFELLYPLTLYNASTSYALICFISYRTFDSFSLITEEAHAWRDKAEKC